jgi:hypothetical protein
VERQSAAAARALKRDKVVNKRVARYFGKTYGWVLGTVSSVVCPLEALTRTHSARARRSAAPIRLWHVVHDDGDEEDLSDGEAIEALRNFKAHAPRKKARKKSGSGKGGSSVVPNKQTNGGTVVGGEKRGRKTGTRAAATTGAEVEVFWDTKSAFGWFVGTVEASKGEKQLVAYEDGAKHWTELGQRRWRLRNVAGAGK